MPEVDGSGRSPRARWVLPALAALLGATWLAMMFGGTGPLDVRLYEALYQGGRPSLVSAARQVTLFGDPHFLIPMTIALALWLWWRGHRHSAMTLVAVTMVGRGVNALVKLDVARPRPTIEPHLVVETTNSFPSGHAAGSLTFFLTVALLLTHRGRWRRLAAGAAVAMAMIVGLTRVMLGVHWPSDVIGGWAFGGLWVIVTLRMAQDLVDRPPVRR